MIDRSARLTPLGSSLQIGSLLAAGFFILLGLVLQLAQFGYDSMAVKNFWFVTMIAGNVWNFLAARSDLPALGELLRFWPMLLVAMGLALLALPYSGCQRLLAAQARMSNRD
ncbi:MAG: hypothetical protein KGL02_00170 [Acidobacteriota bacterium]|nr:hypothetical protein [Acidobacteriota bacterium]MDE3168774.1 hypothetical protein [Acidobacteriota bacterium]